MLKTLKMLQMLQMLSIKSQIVSLNVRGGRTNGTPGTRFRKISDPARPATEVARST